MKFEIEEDYMESEFRYSERDIKNITRRFIYVIKQENKRFDAKIKELESRFKEMIRNVESAFKEKHIDRCDLYRMENMYNKLYATLSEELGLVENVKSLKEAVRGFEDRNIIFKKSKKNKK